MRRAHVHLHEATRIRLCGIRFRLYRAWAWTQGIYGLITAFLILFKIGVIGTPQDISVIDGVYFLLSSLPIAIVGLRSAVLQGRVAASGIHLIAKRPGEVGKAITQAALVETYAIFALLISLLPILFY